MSARPVPFLHVYFAFAAGYLFSYLLRTVNAVISPELTRDLGLSSGSLGLLTSAYFVAFAAMQIPAGMLLDRYGPRRVEPVLLALGGACGVVASGLPLVERWPLILLGIVLAGPLVCATSQAVNDWFDRHVDAINEPQRPIPSGRMPGRWGLYVAVAWTTLSLVVALALGP